MMRDKRSISFLFLWLLLASFSSARAEFPSTQPYPEVRYQHRMRAEPPQHIHILWIEVNDEDVSVRVAPGGPDPDGAGPWQTTLQTPSVIATREQFDVAINGDFFSAKDTRDAEGKKSGYVTGVWASATGPAMTDGRLWARCDKPRPAILFDARKRVAISETNQIPAGARQVLAGSHILVKAGKTVVDSQSQFSTARHPRTAIGIAGDGNHLLFVVVDGRRKDAAGMSLHELAELMLELGCQSAINLDGGGSSEMIMRNPETGELRVLNCPSEGRERAVANVLGVSIRGTRRLAATQPAAN